MPWGYTSGMTNDSDTLTGRTTRPITFSIVGADKRVTHIETFPAGTEVYARPRRKGSGLNVRVCGTLFAQIVPASAVEPY